MITKPPSCVGCPMFGDGFGFVPDLIIPNAKLTILAMSPGKDDERGMRVVGYDAKHPVYEPVEPQPLIGATGYMLKETYLPLTGEKEASLCHVLKCRYQVNGKRVPYLPTGALLKTAVSYCTTAHLSIPVTTKLIVAVGGASLEATQPILTKTHRGNKQKVTKEGERETGGPINEWRGFLALEPLHIDSHGKIIRRT